MSKLIIENRSSASDIEALEAVKMVINGGRISNNKTQYCYCSIWWEKWGNKLIIETHLNQKSDKFVISDE